MLSTLAAAGLLKNVCCSNTSTSYSSSAGQWQYPAAQAASP